jgi:hypothetical protein
MRSSHPGPLFGLSAGIAKDSRCPSRFYWGAPDGFAEGAGFDFAFFLFALPPFIPSTPPPSPFTPQFSPLPAYYLTDPYWHAILSRVCQVPSLDPVPQRHPLVSFSWSFSLFNPFAFKLLRTLFLNDAQATLFVSIACALFPLPWGCILLSILLLCTLAQNRESPATVLPPCAIASERPRWQNGFERSINDTLGNISARPGV